MHVHIAFNGFLVASEAVAASKWPMEVTSGLRIEITDYICYHVVPGSTAPYWELIQKTCWHRH